MDYLIDKTATVIVPLLYCIYITGMWLYQVHLHVHVVDNDRKNDNQYMQLIIFHYYRIFVLYFPHPLTGIPSTWAASVTSLNRSKLSLMEQLMFFLKKKK